MESNVNPIASARIVYFSGTGGARRVAQALERSFAGRGVATALTALEGAALEGRTLEEQPNLLAVVFAVHAFDAPAPVHRWLEHLEPGRGRAMVLSVSGGGEVYPNTGCRHSVCKKLEAKGFEVVYDRMIVMPSNMSAKAPDGVAIRLLRCMPENIDRIADDVLRGVMRRSPKKLGPVRSWLSALEKRSANQFPKYIRIGEACTGCGWCARHCPMGNIEIRECKPVFAGQCAACLRCVYGCPTHAMQSKNFLLSKDGFDLDALERRAQSAEPQDDALPRGWAWKGVRDYLEGRD